MAKLPDANIFKDKLTSGGVYSLSLKNKKILFFVLAFFIAVVVLLTAMINRRLAVKTLDVNLAGQSNILVTVGEEKIFNKDLENELLYYPKKDSREVRELLIKKLVDDSRKLQTAKDAGLITLDASVYNNPGKDYAKRIELVRQAEELLPQTKAGISGKIISVWFLNDSPPEMGIEAAQAIALNKITLLQTAVKSGQMTAEEAVENIRQDSSLALIDASYKENAVMEFAVYQGEKITWEEDFDNELWGLESGGVSEIFTGKSENLDTGETVDAYYMFGTVSDVRQGAAEVQYDVEYN
ncbi:MAG: hypothetical protein UV73_C0008G0050 [Candidatus Gottesmanbacteria bacterium GW2011_GWA2_43_14]|uniref:Uncharacterized protein n=1 Tax=Candidatus Gottesmanbacteria bacterium GW2011_GWA2_43_14 TaxID=1618443 RepID=A0A0G1DI65_9BACT|nr:MAG: hypothetical protein UV73_C0008G0050 [Candidatus Gottesmanbacteria bacterium GW2011_GWA2_43_14]